MNCIDAIEGNVRKIISRLYEVCVSERIEESEYIRGVKIIIEATDAFLAENMEITPSPELVHGILLAHAKKLWMETTSAARGADPSAEGPGASPEADREYLSFYFDHLYHQGNFPP